MQPKLVNRFKAILPIIIGGTAPLLVFAATAGWLGSLSAAFALVCFEPVHIAQITRLPKSDVKGCEIEVVNLTSRPIRVVGRQSTCQCVAPKGLPASIPAFRSVKLAVVLRTEQPTDDVTVTYFLDAPGCPELPVVLSPELFR